MNINEFDQMKAAMKDIAAFSAETMKSLVEAGFTREEALKMTQHIIVALLKPEAN
jgi:hypothetical protein